jgi:hypothetical protein
LWIFRVVGKITAERRQMEKLPSIPKRFDVLELMGGEFRDKATVAGVNTAKTLGFISGSV